MATDWQRYRDRINRCNSTDARCVGSALIDAMADSSGGGPGPIGDLSCFCSGSNRLTCVFQDGVGSIPVDGGPISYTFSRDYEENIISAKNKGRVCDGNYSLWAINTRGPNWWKVADYTFQRDCEDARDSE